MSYRLEFRHGGGAPARRQAGKDGQVQGAPGVQCAQRNQKKNKQNHKKRKALRTPHLHLGSPAWRGGGGAGAPRPPRQRGRRSRFTSPASGLVHRAGGPPPPPQHPPAGGGNGCNTVLSEAWCRKQRPKSWSNVCSSSRLRSAVGVWG